MQKPVVKIFQMNQHRIYNNIYLNQRRMLPVCFLFCLQFAIKHIDHQRFISILFHVIKMRCDVIYCCLIFRRNVSKFARERHCVRLNVANLFGCQVFFFLELCSVFLCFVLFQWFVEWYRPINISYFLASFCTFLFAVMVFSHANNGYYTCDVHAVQHTCDFDFTQNNGKWDYWDRIWI